MKSKTNDIATKSFITYLSLITVLIIGMLPLYYQSIQNMKDKEISKITAELESGIFHLEKAVVDINWAFTKLENDYDYMRLSSMSEPLDARAILLASQVQRRFSAFTNGISPADYVFLCFANSEILMDRERFYRDAESFYGSYLSYSGMDADTLLTTKESALPAHPVSLKSGGDGEYLTLRFSSNSSMSASGDTIYTLLKLETILDLLVSSETASYGALRISDTSDGEIMLTYNPQNISLDENRDITTIRRDITILGFTAEVAVPTDIYLSQAYETMGVVLLLASVSVVLSLILAITHAYRNSLPIRRIMTEVGELAGGRQNNEGSYEYIGRSLASISTGQKNLTQELNNYKSQLYYSWLDSLLSGYISYDKRDELAMGISLPTCSRLLLFGQQHKGSDSVSGRWEYNLDTFTILSIIREKVSDKTIIHEKDNRYVVVMLPSDSSPYTEEDSIHTLVSSIQEAIRQRADFEVVAAISNEITDINLLSREYNRAKNLLESVSAGETLVFLNDYAYEPQPELPLAVLTKLSELMMMGAYEQIAEVYSGIFTPDVLRSEHFHQVYYSLRGRIIIMNQRLSEKNLNQVEIADYDPKKTNTHLVDEQLECIRDICKVVNDNKISHNEKLISDILTFINSHHHDAQMNPEMISSQFRISVKYVSQLIKSSTGKTYSEYLEEIRLSHAVELLREGSKSVSQIAEDVGYVSQNTFYKSFRRVYQMSPSAWRNRDNGPR